MADGRVGWIVLVVVFGELVILVLLMTPDRATAARNVEHEGAQRMLGDTYARQARRFASQSLKSHFMDTGIVDATQNMFVPSDKERRQARGLENFVPQVFEWTQERIDGLWATIYGVYHRLYLAGVILLFGVPVVVPALVDALVERKIAIEHHEVAKPVFFHGAKKALALLLATPLLILFMPFPVHTGIWYAWLFLLPLMLWVTTRHVQEL